MNIKLKGVEIKISEALNPEELFGKETEDRAGYKSIHAEIKPDTDTHSMGIKTKKAASGYLFCLIRFRLYPVAVVLDQLDKVFHSFLLGDIFLHQFFLPVERYLSVLCSHVAVIGIGHLTRTIHNTTHNPDLQVPQVREVFLYQRYRRP